MNCICQQCKKEKLSRDEIGLSKKILGRETEVYLCMQCMSRHFGVSEDALNRTISIYKADGCLLFAEEEDD